MNIENLQKANELIFRNKQLHLLKLNLLNIKDSTVFDFEVKCRIFGREITAPSNRFQSIYKNDNVNIENEIIEIRSFIDKLIEKNINEIESL